jgi:hypothetical protein
MTSKTQETMKEGNKPEQDAYHEITDMWEKYKEDHKDCIGHGSFRWWFDNIYVNSDQHLKDPESSPSPPQPEAQPQQEGEEGQGQIVNIPKVIDLQLGDELPDETVDFNDLHEVTWCTESQYSNDVAYVLQSQLSTLTAENAKLWKALEEMVKDASYNDYVHNCTWEGDFEGFRNNAWQQFKSNLLAK